MSLTSLQETKSMTAGCGRTWSTIDIRSIYEENFSHQGKWQTELMGIKICRI